MTESPAKPPMKFTIVPPHLVAVNMLHHIERMANGQRAKTIHATSRRRHKFKQLQDDILEWRKSPQMHLQDLKAAYTEWRPAGIREITGKPGQFMFSRAIITPATPPKLAAPKKRLSLQKTPQPRIQKSPNLTVGTSPPVKPAQSKARQSPARATPAHPPKNSFYTLEANPTGRTWAQQRLGTQLQQPQLRQQNESDTDASLSPNLLATQSSENEHKEEPNDALLPTMVDQTILELRAMIATLQTQINTVSTVAHSTRDTLHTLDFPGLVDELHHLKRKSVPYDDYTIDHTKLDNRLSQVETDRQKTQWATTADLQLQRQDLATSMTTQIQASITDSLRTTETQYQILNASIKNDITHLNDIAILRETVVDELNNAFEMLRDELSKEVRDNTMNELYDDLKSDDTLQTKLKQLLTDAHDPTALQEALGMILDDQLTSITAQAKDTMGQMLGNLLEPSVHIRNPYNPLDRALLAIQMQVTVMTEAGIQQLQEELQQTIPAQVQTFEKDGIQQIDLVLQGSTDQAVETVMKVTRSAGTGPAPTTNTVPPPEPIPSVTPQRTFRGMNVRIDKSPLGHRDTAFQKYDQDRHHHSKDPHSPPRYSHHHDDYGSSCARPSYRDDEYRQQDHDEFTRRDQEYFMKGHIEASLDTLREDDMIVWYKSVDSYCTLHSVPLLSFQQVRKGADLYPAEAQVDLRERFSRMLSIKLNQSSLIKDPVAKSIINARAGRDDGYGALYALLAASIPIPRLQIHKIIPTTGSNKPPSWDSTLMNVYHYESKIHDYIEHQATKQRFYSDREATQFFLEGLATDESKRFTSALAKALDKLEKTPEVQAIPMDYRLGQIAQTIAELAVSDHEVGTDALTIIGDATVRTTIGDATVNYSRGNDRNKPGKDDSNHRKRFRRPKLDIQCPGCKLWGHDDTTCDFLARTLFALDYTKKHTEKAEKIAEAFCRKNTKEAKAFIKTLSAFPAASRPYLTPNPQEPHLDQTDHTYDDDQDGEDYFAEDFLGSMISGFGLSIKTAAADSTAHNKPLFDAVDPCALQCIHLPPFPTITSPTIDMNTTTTAPSPATIPVVCTIYSQDTPAQADSGANRAITDNISLLHNMRHLDKPFPVGSIDADNKIYCTAIGEFQLITEEGGIEPFPCFYCEQSAGTVISPDHKCTTSSHITKWEQDRDTRTGRGAIPFCNPQNAIIATLPTFRRNGLWYTEISAVPATSEATIRTLTTPTTQHPDSDRDITASAITDSDHHYQRPKGTAPMVKTVTEEALLADEVEAHADKAAAGILDAEIADTPDDESELAPAYQDPFIAPPDEPPPRSTKVTFNATQPSRDPTAPHIEDLHLPQQSLPPTSSCRDWHGQTPPIPKQEKRTNAPRPPPPAKEPPGSQLLTELWHHRMGHPGTVKLRKTQQHTTGIPTLGPLHPLFGCNNCNMAKLTKQSRGKVDASAAQIKGERFHMDYGFFRGPADLTKRVKRKYGEMKIASLPHKPIIESRDGHTAYLLIVDSKTRQVWVFNTKTKEPPIQIVDLFLQRYGLKDGTQRYIRTDLGGKLANSQAF